jgi:hypothetical protein
VYVVTRDELSFPPNSLLEMTLSSENVARLEGYNIVEKMISWSRMGWTHVPLFAFVILALMSVKALGVSLDFLFREIYDDQLGLELEDVMKYWEPWFRQYGPLLIPIPLVLTGICADRFGRFFTLIGLMVLSSAILPILWIVRDPTIFTIACILTAYWLVPSTLQVAYLYAYEFVPLKYRLIVQLSLTLAETMGLLLVGIADNTIKKGGSKEERFACRQTTYYTIALVGFGLCLIIGFLLIRSRDTVLNYMFGAKSDQAKAWNVLVDVGEVNTEEPVPVSREEFMVNANRVAQPSLLKVVRNAAYGPLTVVAGIAFANALWTESLQVAYWYLSVDYLGKGYRWNFLPGLVLQHASAIGGILLTIGLYIWIKDIRFVPACGLLMFGLGAVVCSSVQVYAPDRFYLNMEDITGMPTVIAGVGMMQFGLPVANATFRVLIMDLFFTRNRGRGVFVFKALETFLTGIVAISFYHLLTERIYFLSEASLITAIGAAVVAAFYTTQWFDRSLICRDPEQDACWLVNPETVAQGAPIVGSRDKLLKPNNSGSSV